MNIKTIQFEKSNDMHTAQYMIQQALGFVYQAALRAAAELKIADHLEKEAKTVEQLATETKTEAKILKRILRVLASRKIFKCLDDSRFTLTPEASFLLSDHPYSLRQAILWLTDKTFWLPSAEFAQSAHGKHMFEEIFGTTYFEYWEKNDQPDGFDEGQASLSKIENEFIIQHYDFPKNAIIADIAGGLGNLLLTVLQRNPTLNGILFDQEHVLAKNILHELNDDSRWTIQAGSFFEACPEADIYLLKYITHDWEDSKLIKIFKTIRRAMKPTSKLLILDCIIPLDNEPHFGKELDLICMSAFHDGGEHTEAEFKELFLRAGLKINQVISTNSHISIIETVPA
ncbi:methyltransferase [Providencia burhodogranariea]|uniref:Putative O-methyltransferase n=1 Tax=Providencia burhodogranariea DSM 19968 TaxID=1141662 RepID=K8X881_9GAMM|nr:methyltransferase [Providencia burhodogranariea]EKT64645.1 putative O-methyltransferase [Providencia burhodogranariea DSM 19968]